MTHLDLISITYSLNRLVWFDYVFTHIIIVIIINFTHNSTNDSLSLNFTQFSCPPSMSRAQKKLSVFPLWINLTKASRSIFFRLWCNFFGGVKKQILPFFGYIDYKAKSFIFFLNFRNFIKSITFIRRKIYYTDLHRQMPVDVFDHINGKIQFYKFI